ncbi:MAG: SRPBCC domain-containing protein [Anaerolineae bacterium]
MIPLPELSPGAVVRLRRVFKATPERVFQAWTEPEVLKKWWGPAGCRALSAEIELRVGGTYRIAMQFPGEDIFYVKGVYQEIQSPTKLVFTWRWEKPEMDMGETLVTVEFYAQGSTTEVILTHQPIPSEVSHNYQQGWAEFFDKLAGELGENLT